ncbi:MAG: histidinol-phosphate aminotransferase family protein [Gammaproteobacteria bacterium]|nr:histidinol-phosphate aminotransferase family protein [Gammaproteobacteria bacterium]
MPNKITRRQALLSGASAVGAALLSSRTFAQDAGMEPRPDYLIRAGTNENPYGPSRLALQAINGAMHLTNRYGGIDDQLRARLADLEQLSPDHIVVGTGSGEILRTAGMIASMDKGSVVCADPTYHDLVNYAERAGSKIIRVPVDDRLRIDLDAIASAIRRDTTCVYLVNPNNPIPSIIAKDALRDFVLEVSKKCMVFIDEAYYEYVEDPAYASMMELVRNGHKNVIVARTASKIHGLAGLRTGFGYAHPDHIRLIDEKKTSRQNILSTSAAYASYGDVEFQNFTRRKAKESMAIVEKMFEDLQLRYVRSHANFTFFETGIDVRELNARLREHGIHSGRPFPPFLKWSRISMAKPHEMRYYVQTYKELFG